MTRTWTALTCLLLASCKIGDCGASASRADAGSATRESTDDEALDASSAGSAAENAQNAPATGPIDCSHASGYCPNDDPPTASVHDRCLQSLAHPKCGSAFRIFQECLRDNAKCDAAGKSNLSATTAVCRRALEAFSSCQELNDPRPRSRPM